MEGIAEGNNLRLAFWKAAKGKRGKADCLAFRERLDENLARLRGDILSGDVGVGNYHYFKVRDPKERLICAATFRERVLHHALMNVCEPVLERAAVFDSYACRKGKGRLAAIARARGYVQTHGWFLKMDIRKYFDSVDHETLMGIFEHIVNSYQTAPGRGLPIGNLTSQHFANFYLLPLDRFLKEDLGCQAYVRYMDDFVVWGASGSELRAVQDRVVEFLSLQLKLELKASTVLNRTTFGMDFLGYRLFPDSVRLARRSKVRFIRKFSRYEAAYECGEWTEKVLQRRMQALLGFVSHAATEGLRRDVMERFGVVAKRLQPCESGRQLEQQRDQLSGGVSEQQQPDEQQQQHRVPVRSPPSSTLLPDGGGADPATIPSSP